MMRSILYIFLLLITLQVQAQQTEVQYLSGRGSDDMVQWDFYCTAGMNAGKWSTIGVPSCWELQGFGKYDYGFAKDSVRGKESGLYRKQFNVPTSWKGKVINIVFEGVMTDAEVKINGRLAGAKHQGAFYAFKYDVSRLLNYGKENLLEVKVDKHSSDKSVNAAEREADYWIFGGIFRPVWLEVLPQTYIDDISIDAKADGSFRTKATTHGKQNILSIKIFDKRGKLVAEKESTANNTQEYMLTVKEPALWSSEFPNLYKAVYTLSRGGKAIHAVEKKFGFRTVEVKQRDGIYVNGEKMKFKGVNRHSFRPESGRTTSYKNSVEDVLLIKEMNMNAVRMSHYPPDGHFLDVCDSLGLYVIDELAGWHGHYNTPTGSLRVKEMVEHDRNHPSIVIWANGNEGGSNPELDQLFGKYDLQNRVVIHPWQLNNGIETQHYRQYNYGVGNFENGREIVMPTEFLHGWFDGGHGAGLEDYWNKMWSNPLSAGGFLWDFADQGVLRKDKKDSLDTDKHRGADGIVGPHHEKEGSFFTIKEVWSPIFIERREIADGFDGRFNIENRYQFANANSCTYTWKLKRFIGLQEEKVIDGLIQAPDIIPGGKGQIQVPLPAGWNSYDVLYITVKDQYQQELFTWSYTISRPAQKAKELASLNKEVQDVLINEKSDSYEVTVKDVELLFDKTNGLLKQVRNARGIVPLSNGPVVQEGANNFAGISYRYDKDKNLVISSAFDKKKNFNTLQWIIHRNGWVQLKVNYFPDSLHTKMLGINFDLPERQMRSVMYMGKGPYHVWKNRLKGGAFNVWNKKYNNTETGEQWDYPEFKGYHANFYGGVINTEGQSFTVATETEDLFLRLYSAKWKTDQWHNYEPWFPKGDISFMNAIPSIGSRTQTRETTGPMGSDNIFYDYEKDPTRALRIILWFKFGDK